MCEFTVRSLQLLLEIGLIWNCSWRENNCRKANLEQGLHIQGCMNLKAEPCNNFYNYACGNWGKMFNGVDANIFEPLTLIDYNVNVEMHQVLDQFIMKNKPNFIYQVRNYYESCKNLEKYEPKNYLMRLIIHDQFETPSIKFRKNGIEFDWLTTLAKMRTYDFNDVFIKQIFISKSNDKNTFVVHLSKPDDIRALTYENFVVIMESLFNTMNTKSIKILWEYIQEFEKYLTRLSEETQFEKKSLIKFKDLPLNWLKKYLRIVLNDTVLSPDMELYIQDKSYMLALDKLLQKYNQDFLTLYLGIRFLYFLYLDGPANFNAVDCVSSTRGLMPTAMHWLYEQQHLDLQNEYNTIYKIFNNIRQQFRKTIQANYHNFNANVVQYLQSKLEHMKLKLNNIPRRNTEATLEKFYQDLDLNKNDFYGNHLKLLRFNFKAYRALLDKSKTVLEFTYLESANIGASSSPYFMDNVNTIFVPLTLLQPPLYNPYLDDIYKYSSLGFLLAHEMFHGFDDKGLLQDAHGNQRLIDFKENHSFNNSFNCIMKINPMVINEKIADISGLHYAYHAYFDPYLESIFPLRPLYRQLFFLNFAQFFCGSTTAEVIKSHGSDRDRLTDALTHFPEFAETYKCSWSDRLSAHETCKLWH